MAKRRVIVTRVSDGQKFQAIWDTETEASAIDLTLELMRRKDLDLAQFRLEGAGLIPDSFATLDEADYETLEPELKKL